MIQRHDLSRLALLPVGAVALGAGLWLAAAILAPTALALVIGVVVAPLATALANVGLSRRAAAVATFVATLMLVGVLVLLLQPVVAKLLERAPQILADIRDLIAMVRGFFQGMADVSAAVGEAIAPDASASEGEDSGTAVPSVTDALMLAPGLLSQMLVFVGVLFFFLISRDEVYEWLAGLAGTRLRRRNGAPSAFRARLDTAEREVSRYFLTITLINAALGSATALVLQLIGLPGAIMWGMVVFLANFLPYLGPSLCLVGLLLAGVVAFNGAMSFLPAAAFAALNVVESQFATPTLVARQLSLNPLAVFLSLVFGIWIWGPIGGIVAIPLLLWLRSVVAGADHAGPRPAALPAASAGHGGGPGR